MDATQPLWRQIADDLRAQITQGKLGPGDRVPTERDLAIQWEVARDTARQALEALEGQGLLVAGRPRKVADYRPVTVHVARTADLTHPGESPTMGADSWVGDILRAGQEPTQAAARIVRMQGRLDHAATVQEQLAAAFDWFRTAAKHAEGSEQVVRTLATTIASAAYQLDRDRTIRRAG